MVLCTTYNTGFAIDVQEQVPISIRTISGTTHIMAVKGLKQTSGTISIGARVVESAANTFTQEQIDLNLDPLNREVFVIQAVNLDPGAPDMVTDTPSAVAASLTTTSQTLLVGLDNANCMANTRLDIKTDATNAVSFTRGAGETVVSMLDYIGICATSDMFLSIEGTENLAAKSCNAKIYGYRAQASADIYAALVQSEVLSS